MMHKLCVENDSLANKDIPDEYYWIGYKNDYELCEFCKQKIFFNPKLIDSNEREKAFTEHAKIHLDRFKIFI